MLIASMMRLIPMVARLFNILSIKMNIIITVIVAILAMAIGCVAALYFSRKNAKSQANEIIEKARNNVSPISFRVNDITCSACKQHYDYMPIPDIGGTLLFQVSQRLSNTQINLTEMD